MILVTDIGLQAITNADAGGFLVDLAKFSVTESLDVTLDVKDRALAGAPVYSADIQSIEVVSSSTVKLSCFIPPGVPDVGVWELTEIGIFLKTGELFAHGTFKVTYEKSKEFGIKVYVLVTAGRLGEVINVTLSNSCSLPSVPQVRTLLDPVDSEQNTILVLDALTNHDDSTSASLALKYGQGGINWAYLGYNRVYNGVPGTIFDLSTFGFDINTEGGFWLNDKEIVLVQIISGPGSGESRRVRYSKESGQFVALEKPFEKLTEESILSIWRNSSHALPGRTPDLPEYMVLGVGTNTWEKDVTYSSSGDLVPVKLNLTSTGSTEIPLTSGMPANKDNYLVFIDGKCLDKTQFGYASDTLVLSASPAVGAQICVVCFAEVVSTGSSLIFYEANYNGDGTTWTFNLPMVPDSDSYVLVFVNGEVTSDYTLQGASVVFSSQPPAASDLISLVTCANYEELGASTTIDRETFISDGSPSILVSTVTFEKRNTFVTRNNKYVKKDDYEVSQNTITFNTALTAGDVISYVIFSSSVTADEVAPSGVNTGPIWTDPAGVDGTPNTLVPIIMPYVGDASNTSFSVPTVKSNSYILGFVDGVLQSPLSFTYSSNHVTFSEAPAAGLLIDLICFTEVASDGSSAVCRYSDFLLEAGVQTYPIVPVDNPDSVIVTIGGVYQHKATYTLGNGTITLTGGTAGLKVEVWAISFTATHGFRTLINVDYFRTSVGGQPYVLKNKVSGIEKTLVFVGRVSQNKDTYSLVTNSSSSSIVFGSLDIQDSTQDLVIFSFVSDYPKTRLMLRTEVEADYMPLRGPNVKWSNLTQTVKESLACPITKLLGLLTGSFQASLNSSSADATALAQKYGLAPVHLSLSMDVIPTANYASIGAGAALGVSQVFNVYKYLEIYLKDQLGTSSFTIHDYEQGKKYFIDNIHLNELQYEVVPRDQIPMMTWSTGIFVNYPNKLMSSTYPTMPLLTNFLDMKFSCTNVTLPSGFADDSRLRTVSVALDNNDNTQVHTFTHQIQDDYSGRQYTCVWSRPYVVVDQNIDYMTEVSTGGAPSYVRYFARLYADWRYNDSDLRACMFWNKATNPVDPTPTDPGSDCGWVNWLNAIRGGYYGGNYPAIASYTANLAFGVSVSNFDPITGDATLLINITSGTIGYSYFPANLLIKSITIPVDYTIYPALNVNPDGTITPMVSTSDLFDSCCWGPVDAKTNVTCEAENPGVPDVVPTVTADIAQGVPGTIVTVTVAKAPPNSLITYTMSDSPVESRLGVANSSGALVGTMTLTGSGRTFLTTVYANGDQIGRFSLRVLSVDSSSILINSIPCNVINGTTDVAQYYGYSPNTAGSALSDLDSNTILVRIYKDDQGVYNLVVVYENMSTNDKMRSAVMLYAGLPTTYSIAVKDNPSEVYSAISPTSLQTINIWDVTDGLALKIGTVEQLNGITLTVSQNPASPSSPIPEYWKIDGVSGNKYISTASIPSLTLNNAFI